MQPAAAEHTVLREVNLKAQLPAEKDKEQEGTAQTVSLLQQLVQTPITRPQQHAGVHRKYRNGTHNDTVLAYVHIGADLGRVDNTVLFYEDMVTNVQREESHPATGEQSICMCPTNKLALLDPESPHGVSRPQMD